MLKKPLIDAYDLARIKKGADQMIKVNTEIREGQAIFNATKELFPKAAESLKNTEWDCFYEDDRIIDFL